MTLRRLILASTALLAISCNRSADAGPGNQLPGSGSRRQSAGMQADDATVTAEATPMAPQASRGEPIALSAQPPHLGGEGSLLTEGALSADKTTAVLQTDAAFEQTLRQFELDAARHPEAQDLTAHYQKAIASSLGQQGKLDALACGYSLCVGSIRSGSEDTYEQWSERFAASSGSPSYTFADLVIQRGEKTYEGRFVFSTDPNTNAFYVEN